mgnify:FL=1
MNVKKVKGKDVEIPSISIQRRYTDNGEWKSTNSMNANDLPRAILVLGKAYDYLMSRNQNKAGDQPEEETVVEE